MKKTCGIYIGFIIVLALVEKIGSIVFNGLTIGEGFVLFYFLIGMILACVFFAMILSKALHKEAYRFPQKRFDCIYLFAISFYPFLFFCEYIIDFLFFSTHISFIQFVLVRIHDNMEWLNYEKYKWDNTIVTISQISVKDWGVFLSKWFLFALLIHKTIKDELTKCPFNEKMNVYYDVSEIKSKDELNRNYLLNLMPKKEREQVVGDIYVYYCIASKEGFIQYKKMDGMSYTFDLMPDQIMKFYTRIKVHGKKRWIYYSISEKEKYLKTLHMVNRIFAGLTIFFVIFSMIITIYMIPFPIEHSKAVITDKVFEKYVTPSKYGTTYKKFKYYCTYQKKNKTYQKGYITNQDSYEDWNIGDKITVYYSPDIKNGEQLIYQNNIFAVFILWGITLVFLILWINCIRNANYLKKNLQK